tara:strand:- start:274 stop:492 length:219 start_codon:yes stop_codon:yes gene_type:complete
MKTKITELELIIKPSANYKLTGTSIQLSKDQTYSACNATNQPDWKEKGLIFVDDDWGYGFMLKRGEYTIIEA